MKPLVASTNTNWAVLFDEIKKCNTMYLENLKIVVKGFFKVFLHFFFTLTSYTFYLFKPYTEQTHARVFQMK